MFDVMQRGGDFMWVILAASVIALAIVAERGYVYWVRFRIDAPALLAQIIGFLDARDYGKAIEACEKEGGNPIADVMKAGLLKADEADKDIQRAMEAATLRALPKVTQRLGFIAVLANVATLLGLLGTIMGLIEAFRGVAAADAAAKQDILSKGIAVAMFTTAFGLIAAVGMILMHALLQSRQNGILAELEATATDLFRYLSERNRKMSSGR